jgi:hypothetical protein
MKSRLTRMIAPAALAAALALAGCAQSAPPAAPAGPGLLHWSAVRHLTGVVDVAGPSGDGALTVAAGRSLFTLSPSGALTPFAQGRGGYADTTGSEAYIAVSGADAVPAAHCSFQAGTTFALRLGTHPGLIAVSPAGQARPFATLPAHQTPDGITFDTTGTFGHQLVVIDRGPAHAAVLAVDCAGGVHTITTQAPRMEGGIAVAPASFPRFGGDLITADEVSGTVYAITPAGAVATLVKPRQPAGGDIGVESVGFVPPGFGPGGFAYLADHFEAKAKFTGTDSLLRLSGRQLAGAGVRPGDLLVATEGGARTLLVRCAATCAARLIGAGGQAHAEGHIAFTSP